MPSCCRPPASTRVKELKYRNPAKLAKAMAEANTKRKLVRVLPSDQAVVRWIEHAKQAAAQDQLLTSAVPALDTPGPRKAAS